jgi:hypothetical protein
MAVSRKGNTMKYFVLVRAEAPDHYLAQAVGFPEVKAEGRTEAEAVDGVRRSLKQLLAKGKMVPVEISLNGGNPWLEGFGRSADDPDFDAYLDEIRMAREANAAE